MMPWMIPLIGAIGGGLMNKKDPLKGALLGGGLGALGGAALPGMVGSAGAAGAGATGVAGSGAAGAATGGGLLSTGAASVIPQGMTAAQMGALQAEAAATGIDVGSLMASQGIAQPMTATGSAGGFTNGALFNSGTSAPIFEKGVQASPEAIKAISDGKTMGGLLKTAGNAAQAASAVKQMTPEEPPIQASPISPAVPNPGPSNFYNSILQEQQARQMAEMQKRLKMRQRWG